MITANTVRKALAGDAGAIALLKAKFLAREIAMLDDYGYSELRDIIADLWSGNATPICQRAVADIVDELTGTGCDECGGELERRDDERKHLRASARIMPSL